ncbi:hypothetical protein CEXT_101011, partial [Caerostris extrusa]
MRSKVYVKDDVWCMKPPILFIPNGQLRSGRDKATLHCEEGYTEREMSVFVCEKEY